MTIGDFFSFDEVEYAQRISSYSVQRLKDQEINKFRTEVGSVASIGIGGGFAVFTGGLSLVGSAYGGRRLYVAQKKLEIIELELIRRGYALHETTKRDYLIPLVVAGSGVALVPCLDGATGCVAGTVGHVVNKPVAKGMAIAVGQVAKKTFPNDTTALRL